MTHQSYADQNEDTIMWDLVDHKANGFFIDAGAAHPVFLNVSKSFYDEGWTGINIEPLPWHAEELREAQPHSITVEAALSDVSAESMNFTAIRLTDPRGHPDVAADMFSTLDPAVFDTWEHPVRHNNPFVISDPIQVKVTTLADVCREHVPEGTVIDWLKIDVEGYETQVIQGADWDRWRPTVLCIEWILDGPEKWEHLLPSEYEMVQADWLNRYYRLRRAA